VAGSIITSGTYKRVLYGVEITITSEDVEIIPHYPEEYVVSEFKYGVVAVDTKISAEELTDGLVRGILGGDKL